MKISISMTDREHKKFSSIINNLVGKKICMVPNGEHGETDQSDGMKNFKLSITENLCMNILGLIDDNSVNMHLLKSLKSSYEIFKMINKDRLKEMKEVYELESLIGYHMYRVNVRTLDTDTGEYEYKTVTHYCDDVMKAYVSTIDKTENADIISISDINGDNVLIDTVRNIIKQEENKNGNRN